MTAPTYALRPSTDDDYAFLESLHNATMRDVVTQVWGWDDAVQQALFRRNFDPSRSQIVVVDEVPAGVIAIERRDDAWFLANIEIAPAHQSRGLGAQLIGAILAQAHAAGLPVTLQVLKVNRAQHLYERLGFVVTGSTETHFLMRAEPPR
jgi:ribosomal protein S18 acetylase RimI-like enzyme